MDVILGPVVRLSVMVVDLYMWVVIISVVLSWLVAFNVVNLSNRFVYVVGDLANRLAHPRYGVPRKYLLQVVGNPTAEVLGKLLRGMKFAEGVFRAKNVKRVRSRGRSTFLEIELTQGHNREIRRLLARLGHKVIHLQRISFGPLKLGRLPLGKFRPLRTVELNALRDLAAGRKQSKTARPAKKRRTAPADTPRSGRKPSRPRRQTSRRK